MTIPRGRRIVPLVLGLWLVAAAAAAHAPGRGPNGGQVQHLGNNTHVEVVASGNTLRLYVSTPDDKPLPVDGATATATVLVDGRTEKVQLHPAGGNVMQGSGQFSARTGMKVVVAIAMPGQRPAQGRFTPLD
jgi:hypothetical protein